jgi:hypothetical protein
MGAQRTLDRLGTPVTLSFTPGGRGYLGCTDQEVTWLYTGP